MVRRDTVESTAEPLIELLAAQCSDLEVLLGLARREVDAAERRDFEEVMRVVAERATLGERLEAYHRQIADMRARLGDAGEAVVTGPATARLAMLVADIQTADARTMPLLLAARSESSEQLVQMDAARRTVGAYSNARIATSIALDRRA